MRARMAIRRPTISSSASPRTAGHEEGAALGRRDLAERSGSKGGAGLLLGERRAGGDLGEIGLERVHAFKCAPRAACHLPRVPIAASRTEDAARVACSRACERTTRMVQCSATAEVPCASAMT
jgi:hypothetical protein